MEVLWDGTSRAAADGINNSFPSLPTLCGHCLAGAHVQLWLCFLTAQLEQDVKEALFAIAKQKGKIDPNVSCT